MRIQYTETQGARVGTDRGVCELAREMQHQIRAAGNADGASREVGTGGIPEKTATSRTAAWRVSAKSATDT